MNLSTLSVRRPILTTCVVIALLVIGVFSFDKLPIDLYPEANIPTISITTIYPGAGPTEIETLISKPLEDAISNAAGIKKLTSSSYEGMSRLIVEFNDGIKTEYAEQIIRDKVNQCKPKFPQDTKEPIITKVDLSALPIMMATLSADLPQGELFDLADQVIKPRIEQVDNVGSVEIMGGRKREWHVELDRNKLIQKQLSVLQVSSKIAEAGQNVPAGKVSRTHTEQVFRSLGEFKKRTDVENVLVGLFGNENPIRVKDLGTVTDTLEDERFKLRYNGNPALMFQIYRQSGSNTLAVATAVKKKIQAIQEDLNRQKGAPVLIPVIDSSKEIRNNVNDVYETIFISVVLTILAVLLFLMSPRSTLITSLSLPISLIGAFTTLYIANFSVNIVTLMAMSLAVGLLVDDSIVVIENIYRRLESGESVIEATIKGASQIQLSVTAITLVIISVFLPFSFTSGVIGQMLKQFGLTVTFAMAISLFVSLTVIPMLTSKLAKEHSSHADNIPTYLRFMDRFQDWLETIYDKALRFTLKNRKSVIVGVLIFFVITSMTFIFVSKDFMPANDSGTVMVTIERSPGTSLDDTFLDVQRVEEAIKKYPDLKLTILITGSRQMESHKATIFALLKDQGIRKTTTHDFKTWLRQAMKEFSSLNPIIQEYSITSSQIGTRPLALDLMSNDASVLDQYATKLLARLKQDPRLKEVDTSVRSGRPEFQVQLNSESARTYGINSGTMGMELRGQVEGFTPATFRERGYEYDVRVRLKPDQRDLQNNFASTYIPNVNFRPIRLADVATGKVTTSVTDIQRKNRARVITIQGDLASGTGIGEVMASIQEIMKSELPCPPEIRTSFAGHADMFNDMVRSMIIAAAFAMLFIFLILSSLYESFVTPFTILVSLPLALCGAFFSLYITHTGFDIFTIFGIFMLLGVAGKNSILLVDFILQKMKEGMNETDAILAAGKDRLRPILMTSLALIAGAVPIAIGLNAASAQRTSMGITIIGGMITSTVLTLLVVPAIFTYIEKVRLWFQSYSKRIN